MYKTRIWPHRWADSYIFLLIPVGEAPELLAAMKDVKVIAPKTATLTCDFTAGKPPAKVKWFKDGTELSQSRRVTMTYQDKRATLAIVDTELSDASTYMCVADNKVKRIDCEAKLTVQSKCL